MTLYFIFVSFVRVYVDISLISSAGEGLFTKIDAETGTVMSFYNGVRITHQEVKWRELLIAASVFSCFRKLLLAYAWVMLKYCNIYMSIRKELCWIRGNGHVVQHPVCYRG